VTSRLDRGLSAVPDVPPRAVLYLRQSVARDESISLELQETACRDYCARRGYRVVEVIADPGISGRTWNRPGVQRTIALVEQGGADVVVLWRWSRLSRSRRDWAVAVDRVDVAGGAIESATEPVDTSTAAGRLQRGMLAELAAWESEVKGEQWKETHARRRAHGLPHGGGYRPGYVYESKTYRPDPDTAPLVTELYRRYADGQGLRPLAVWLTAVGVPSRATGSAWTHRGISSLLETGWAAGHLHVHDPACLCRKPATCRRRVHVPGAHQAIVDGQLWDAYLAERRRRGGTPRRQLNPTTPLAGLVRCAGCGYGMRTKKGRGPAGYYACETAGCPQPTTIIRTRAEQAARDWLDGLAHEVARAAELAASADASQAASRAAVTRLARAAGQLEAELTQLTRQLTRGVIPESVYITTRDELLAEQATAAAALAEARAAVTAPGPAPGVARDVLLAWDELPAADLNAALRDLLRVIVTRGTWRPTVRVVPAWDR